jgi:hypothetical protein
MLTPSKRKLKIERAERKVLRPGSSNAVWCRPAALVQGENKIPCRQFVGEKAPQRAQKRLAAKAFAGGA